MNNSLIKYEEFKREISKFFDRYDFSIEHINIHENEVIIEGINWCYDFTIDFSFNEKISNLLKSSDYKIRFKIYRFDEDAEWRKKNWGYDAVIGTLKSSLRRNKMQLSYPNRTSSPKIPYVIVDRQRFPIRKVLKEFEEILNKKYAIFLHMIPDEIVIIKEDKGVCGSYYPKQGVIHINSNLKHKHVLRTLLHEFGHHVYFTNRQVRINWNKYYIQNLTVLNGCKFIDRMNVSNPNIKSKRVIWGISGTITNKLLNYKRKVKMDYKLKKVKVFKKTETNYCIDSCESFAEVFSLYMLDNLVHKSNKLKMQELLKVYENDETAVH